MNAGVVNRRSNAVERFRILHIAHSLEMGGLERVVVDLARGFKKKGHHISICCLATKGVLGDETEREGFKVFSFNKRPRIDWMLPYRISKIIRDNNFNTIHTHNEAGLLYGVTGALLSRVGNIVHTEHGKEPGCYKKRLLSMCESFLLKRTKRIVTVSEDLKLKTISSYGLKNNKVFVIPNGIDVSSFWQPQWRDKKRGELGVDSSSFIIGSIGRLVPLKNYKFLLSVFRELINEVQNLKLIIVGDGPLRQDLENYSNIIGLSDSVMFLGERNDIAELLSTLDLFVLPSITEGISITLLEAMASGTPIVASEVGGNCEVIENGISGLLVPLGNISMWVKIIKSLIENVDKRRILGEMANRRVTQRFSLSATVENYEKLYNA